jgi:Cyclin, N-terminal domain
MNDSEEDRYQAPDRRSNTTSSAQFSSSIYNPNVRSILQSVATIIHSQMLEDASLGREIQSSSDLFYFSEEKYIREHPEAFDEQRRALLRKSPTIDDIFEFMRALYDCAQFSPECCIICLVYINRLIAFTGLPLSPSNWRPIILCSFLIGQKVWDDRYLSNADFAYIYPFFNTEEINKLEKKFLELINYSVTVKAALYAKYYFELRGLYNESNNFPIDMLENDKAKELEGRSQWITKIEKEKAMSRTTVPSTQRSNL